MRKTLLFLSLVMFVGCASSMKRTGYNVKDLPVKTDAQCNIPIKRSLTYKNEEVDVLGTIQAGDSGFSVKCGEAYVLKQFQQEGCALGADLVNILDEKRIDILSSCYRAKAEFVRFKDREKAKSLASDPLYVR